MHRILCDDFAISNIALCCFVPSGKGRPQFRDRPHHGVALLCDGEFRFSFGSGVSLTLHGGELIYLPKGSDYRVHRPVPGDCYAINFDVADAESGEPFVVSAKDYASFYALFSEAVHCWKRKNRGDLLRCRSLLYAIFAKLQTEQALGYESSVQLERIRPAAEYMREHFTDEKLRIAALAGMCGITPEYFRKLFRQQFGISPLKHIHELRIAYAEELMQTGNYSVSEAAMHSGFGDLSQFSREFRRLRGFPPSVYLRRKTGASRPTRNDL